MVLHIKEGLKYFVSLKVGHTFTPYCCVLTGHSFSKIVVHTPPQSANELKWLDSVLAQRLQLDGEIIYHCEVPGGLGYRTKRYDLKRVTRYLEELP